MNRRITIQFSENVVCPLLRLLRSLLRPRVCPLLRSLLRLYYARRRRFTAKYKLEVLEQADRWGRPCLRIASLYLFPEERRAGYGTLAMCILEGVAWHLGLEGVRLETDWLWQGAVRFYLQRGFWVQNRKRGLSLVRWFADPPYRIRCTVGQMDFVLGGGETGQLAITARRQGDTLIWEEHATCGRDDDPEPLAATAPTFALWLAIHGWPLIRGPLEWERRYRWSDTGMPEGLAYKITVFEGYARHCGFRVDTPPIPGLVYPLWSDL